MEDAEEWRELGARMPGIFVDGMTLITEDRHLLTEKRVSRGYRCSGHVPALILIRMRDNYSAMNTRTGTAMDQFHCLRLYQDLTDITFVRPKKENLNIHHHRLHFTASASPSRTESQHPPQSGPQRSPRR